MRAGVGLALSILELGGQLERLSLMALNFSPPDENQRLRPESPPTSPAVSKVLDFCFTPTKALPRMGAGGSCSVWGLWRWNEEQEALAGFDVGETGVSRDGIWHPTA